MISKGKPHLVLALHRAGQTPDAIRETIGMPKKTIDRYIADFALGAPVENFDGYVGKPINLNEFLDAVNGQLARRAGG